MAAYPETPKPLASSNQLYRRSTDFLTIRSGPVDSGVVLTRAVRTWPIYSIQPLYGWRKNHSDFQTLIDFFYTQKGGSGKFTFSDFEGWSSTPVGAYWPARLIAVADGVTTIFDLPMKSSSSYHLLKNGTDDAANEYVGSGSPAPGKWKFLAGIGVDGRDQVQFGTAPTAGMILEWKGVGRLTVWARFMTDSLSEPILSAGTISLQMPLVMETR